MHLPVHLAFSTWGWCGGKGDALLQSVTSCLEKWLMLSQWILSSFHSCWRITSVISPVSASSLDPFNSVSATREKRLFFFFFFFLEQSFSPPHSRAGQGRGDLCCHSKWEQSAVLQDATRKHFFTAWVTEHWHMLPRQAPFLELPEHDPGQPARGGPA